MQHYEPLDVEGNAERAELLAKRRQELEQLWDSDLEWMMAGERGRRFMYRLLFLFCCIDHYIETNNALEQSRMAGRENVGKTLRNAIDRVCPEQYAVMLAEQEQLRGYEHAGRD